ncbi:MAG: SEC-C metal-binding domain-containing protein [Anaerolineae bacterium]
MTIASIGRNDPCPCGSGKKYKNCCMRKDRLEAARNTSVRSEEAALYATLTQYVIQPRFAAALTEGIAMFWRGQFAREAGEAIDSEGVRRMVEWFVIDYRYGPDRQRLIDLFIETEAQKFVESLRNLVLAWSESLMGAFRYQKRSDEEHLSVYDPLAERQLSLRSRLLAQNARPGDLLVGRVYALDGEHWLTPATLVLPRDFEQPMIEYVHNARRIYADEHPQATLDQFLSANGHIFNAFLLSDRAESLRGLIGPGTRFLDPAITRDKMREITHEQQRQQAARDAAARSDPTPQIATRRSAGGVVLPGADSPEPDATAPDAPPRRPTILIPGRDT